MRSLPAASVSRLCSVTVAAGLAALVAVSIVAGAGAQPAPAGGGGPAVNRTVFHGEHIRSVTAVTEVFGRSQRITAAVVEYDADIRNGGLSAAQWTVAGRTITGVYANNRAEKAAEGRDGRFIVLELDPDDESAVTFAPDVDEPAETVVSQVEPVQSLSGETYGPTATAIINTRQANLIVDDFRQFRFTDPVTGLLLTYNLFVPKDYDPQQSYPLVLFMHDAGVTGSNPLRTLQQGLGAVSFASAGDQAKHPSFVLAPQYPVALANDASQISDYADITVRLIEDIVSRYAIDESRLYTTGQSGGCMTSIALNIKYPDLFAASLLVAGQWDPAQVAPLAAHRMWIIVSQDDAKAYPGMNAITEVLEANGATVRRAVWDGRSSEAEFQAAVEAVREDDADSNVYYTVFREGTVVPDGIGAGGASGHVWTWPIAYAIPGVRDWLFEQRK